MDMDMKQLEYFLVLSEQEHMSSSAAFIGISQPALSKSIANLEKEVGTKLFDRYGNAIKLNDYGKNFAVYARKALDNLHSGFRIIKQAQYDTCGEIRIVCHAFADCITDCILAYTELNPKIRITVGQSQDKDENLTEQTDFVLGTQSEATMLSKNEQAWFFHPLFEEQHCILISPRYRRYPENISELSMEELKDDFFIEMPDVTIFYSDITYKLCRAAGYSPKIFCSTEDFITKMRFVDAGKAICILPECCLRVARQLSPDIRTFHIKNYNTSRQIFLMRRKESLMSEAALDFWNFVQDYFPSPDSTSP
ncbi:LysR family transcriptional regulator [Hominifimenecus sp. rT4P-3]|uniref:LysR family transcriptional regulator n=1 Tax=Hominifimenecus sp. rT4P-3 TaxID=3242979 RepID=UPI003DA418A1